MNSAFNSASPTMLPWAKAMPSTTASFVLRYASARPADVSTIVWLIAEFALELPTWEEIITPAYSDATALRAVQCLVAHKVSVAEYDNYDEYQDFMMRYRETEEVPPSIRIFIHTTSLDRAGALGFYEVVKFMVENTQWEVTAACFVGAASMGHLAIVRYVCEQVSNPPVSRDAMALDDNENQLEGFLEEGLSTAITAAAAGGHCEIVRYLHETMHAQCDLSVWLSAVESGSMALIKYLWAQTEVHRAEGWARQGVAIAAGKNHLHVVKWLDSEFGFVGDRCEALQRAVRGGHFEVTKYLLPTVDGSCELWVRDMNDAAQHGSIDLIMLLYEAKLGKFTRNALVNAAKYGHLDIVKFLVDKDVSRGPVKAEVMDHAAEHGWLDILKYLYTVPSHGCTSEALVGAVRQGHLDVVKYLVEEHPDVLENEPLRFKPFVLGKSCSDIDVLRYVLHKGLVTLTAEDFVTSCKMRKTKRAREIPWYLSEPKVFRMSDEMLAFAFDHCIEPASDEIRTRSIAEALGKMAWANSLDQIRFLDSRRRPGEVYCSEAPTMQPRKAISTS